MIKLKLTAEQLVYLRSAIWQHCRFYKETELKMSDDKDFIKMLIAFMEEFHQKLLEKEVQGNLVYTLKISPLWGFCLRLLFAGNLDRTGYMGNIVAKLCDEVDRAYIIN